MLKKPHRLSGQKNEISLRVVALFEKAFQWCKDRANRTSNGEVMVKTMDRDCIPLKKLSNSVKIEQIGQVTEKLWSKL
ncbi:hypothetical protein OROMI_034694 [Orobanche minor]